MATQTIEFIAAGGLSLVAKLFNLNNDTVVQTASSVTEATNRKSMYNAIFTNVPAGTYQLIAYSGANSVALWEVDLTLSTGTFRAYDPLNPVSIRTAVGLYTNNLDAQLLDIKNSIAASTAPIVFPVINKTIDRISDSNIKAFYDEEINIDIILVDENNDPVDITSKTLKVVIEDALGNDIELVNDVDLIKSTGNVRFTLDPSVTGTAGVYKYALRDITSQNIVLAYGNIDVEYVPEVDSGNQNYFGSTPADSFALYGQQFERAVDNNFNVFYNEDVDVTISSLLDDSGNLLDTSSKTLKVVIENHLGEDIKVIQDANLTKGSGYVTFNIDEVVTANIGNYVYSLRDISNSKNTVLRYGNIDVQYIPENI